MARTISVETIIRARVGADEATPGSDIDPLFRERIDSLREIKIEFG